MRDVKFPQRVKRGSCGVMIYSTPSKGRQLFTLSYYDANQRRCRPSFASYAEAKKNADEIVEKLAAGQMDVMTLCGQERLAYERAFQALRSLNMSVDIAATQFAEATRILNGASLLDAAKLFARQNPQFIKIKRVSEVVEELIRTKRDKGRSELYQKDLRLRLGRFANAFECSISNVSPGDIDRFIGGLKVAARTRNNFRLAIGTLFKFAQSKGYVGKEHQGIGSIEKETEIVKKVEVFTPHEIESLLRGAPDELIPALAIGACGGVRSE